MKKTQLFKLGGLFVQNKLKQINQLSEKDLEKYLEKKIKNINGLTFKFVSPSFRGVPDRVVIFSGDVYFIELKAPNKKNNLSALQKECITAMKQAGANVCVIWNKSQVDEFVNSLQNN